MDTRPPAILAQVNFMVAEGEWTIDDIVAYLADAQQPRSRSAVGRHAQKVEKAARRLRESRQITEAVVAEMGDAAVAGKQGRLLVEITRTLVFDMLDKFEDGAMDPQSVAFLGKGLKDLAAAARHDQEFESKIRAQVAQEEREKALAAVEEVAAEAVANNEPGFSAETVDAIRRQIMGVEG